MILLLIQCCFSESYNLRERYGVLQRKNYNQKYATVLKIHWPYNIKFDYYYYTNKFVKKELKAALSPLHIAEAKKLMKIKILSRFSLNITYLFPCRYHLLGILIFFSFHIYDQTLFKVFFNRIVFGNEISLSDGMLSKQWELQSC